MLGRIDNCSNKLIHYLPERKEIAANLHLREVNDSFGKGFHTLKPHVLNCSMTVPTLITAVMAEVPLAFFYK